MSAPGSVTPEVDAQALTTSTPLVADAVSMWEIAAASRVLDVKPRYAYALMCRDFSATSIVARLGDRVVGYVTGYLRPDAPDTLFVWQVAVHADARGRRAAATMLDELVSRVRATFLETTITADNDASIALFSGLAQRRGAGMERTELFDGAVLGADHDPEFLYRIGPMTHASDDARTR
ncbi:diaminobutyrate acetyltransferase [Pseudonocardia sp.]|uniref:diaminobutyrate acetyltransferase n=1 Tax=Pseudonocardia sp. TaxID=60912 RepID=UPI0026315A88|nr:diaminobutyrate acetyltransferase [Pseudonocardia sp.]